MKYYCIEDNQRCWKEDIIKEMSDSYCVLTGLDYGCYNKEYVTIQNMEPTPSWQNIEFANICNVVGIFMTVMLAASFAAVFLHKSYK